MSERNENRPGYKKTKVGWIPEEWELSHVGKVCLISNHLRFPISQESRRKMQGEYPYYGPTGIQDFINHYRVEGTYALIGEDGDHFLKYRNRPMTLLVSGKFNVNNHAHLVKGGKECSTKWFFWFFHHRNITSYLTRQGAGRYKLKKETLEKLPIIIPSPSEQRKIAEILSTWDRGIEQVGKLIDAKQRLKKGLMQKLLTGRMRFPEFGKPATKKEELPEGWKEMRLGECFNERKENNLELPLLSITSDRGVISRIEVDRKDTSNADKSKYKCIAPGDIGYNTMRMWQGVSAVSDLEGIVSPAYTICTPRIGHHAKFYGYFFKFSMIIHLFWRYSQGLVNDTLSLKFHNFAQIKISCPKENEQRRIASVLESCDREIEILRRKESALKQQKKGLMQKLLTGKIRVK